MLIRYCALCCLLLLSCGKKDVTIIFGGDVMLDRGVRSGIRQHGADYYLEDLKTIFHQADFTVVNLECSVTDMHSPLTKQFVFRADPEVLPALRNAGITHCILANNHTYDHRREGMVSTAHNLVQADLTPVGYGTTQPEACAPVIFEKDGIRIALFSSVTLPLESWMYLENAPGMCQATVDDLATLITTYKATHADDYVIVTLHWGIEYQPFPTLTQRQQAKKLIEAGADAIIGHHPHVVQRMEVINGKPVYYSVGNLIFDNPRPETHYGILVKLRFSPGSNVPFFEEIPYEAKAMKPTRVSVEHTQVTGP